MKSVFSLRIAVNDSQVTPESSTRTLRCQGWTTGDDARVSSGPDRGGTDVGESPKLDAVRQELLAASVPSGEVSAALREPMVAWLWKRSSVAMSRAAQIAKRVATEGC